VDEVGELGGIPDEENRGIVEHPIPVTLICPKLDRKPTGVTRGISRSRLSADSGETGGRSDLLADRTEE
jgi:hypothetical protein